MIKKLFCLFVVIILAFPLYAKTLKGIKMADTIEVEGHKLVLNGMAVRKKYVFVKVYIAGLYLPTKEKNAEKIFKSDLMRQTIMHFVHKAGAGKINDAWYEGLKANTPDHSPELKKQFDELCSWIEDIKVGDRLIFTYIPEKGTEVKVKGKIKGVIKGKSFADALFKCWIGPKPGPGKGFKEDLLGI